MKKNKLLALTLSISALLTNGFGISDATLISTAYAAKTLQEGADAALITDSLNLTNASNVFQPVMTDNGYRGLVQAKDGSVINILGSGVSLDATGQAITSTGEVIGQAVSNLGLGNSGFGDLLARPLVSDGFNTVGFTLADSAGQVIGSTITNSGGQVFAQVIASAGGNLLNSASSANLLNMDNLAPIKDSLGNLLSNPAAEQLKNFSSAIPSLQSIGSIGSITNLDGLGSITDTNGLFGDNGLTDGYPPCWRARKCPPGDIGSYFDPTGGLIAQQNTLLQLRNQMFPDIQRVRTRMGELYDYITSGVMTVADNKQGLLATMAKLAATYRETLEQNMHLSDAFDAVNAGNKAYSDVYTNAIPSPLACLELATKSAGGGLGAVASAGQAIAKGKVDTKIAAAAGPGAKPNTLSHSEDLLKEHKAKYCSPTDVTFPDGNQRKAFDCTSVSDMPDGDARVQSIFAPAYKFTDRSAQPKNLLTYDKGTSPADAPELNAAIDASKNIYASYSPPFLPKEVEKTPLGKTYLAKSKVLQARNSVSEFTLNSMIAKRTAGFIKGQAVDELWTSPGTEQDAPKAVYARLFGSNNTPEIPSFADILRLNVYKRYFDTGSTSWSNYIANLSDEADLMKQELDLKSQKLLLYYQISELNEQKSMLLASLLSQKINPITPQALDALANQAKTSLK